MCRDSLTVTWLQLLRLPQPVALYPSLVAPPNAMHNRSFHSERTCLLCWSVRVRLGLLRLCSHSPAGAAISPVCCCFHQLIHSRVNWTFLFHTPLACGTSSGPGCGFHPSPVPSFVNLVPVSCIITSPKGEGGRTFFFLPFCNRIKIVDKLLNGWGFFTIFNISEFFFFLVLFAS